MKNVCLKLFNECSPNTLFTSIIKRFTFTFEEAAYTFILFIEDVAINKSLVLSYPGLQRFNDIHHK